MTKGALIEQVYMKVTAARPSGDVPIHKGLIENLMAPAINFIVVGEYRLRRDERRGDISPTDSHSVDPEFLATIEEDVQKCNQRGKYFITPRYRVQALPHSLGIDEIYPCNGSISFYRVKSESELIAQDEQVMNMITAYWLEQTTSGQRVYFSGLPPTVTKVRVNMVVSTSELAFDDELPLPESVQMQAIDLLFNHFVGIRQLPADPIADGK